MHETTIARLERSLNLLAPHAEELADGFFATLFSENPGLRPFFPPDLIDQKRKLVAALMQSVSDLRSCGTLPQPFLDFGQMRPESRVSADHYGIVRDTLIEVMANIGGEAWNHQLDRAWREAFDQASAATIAASPKTDTTPTPNQA